MLVLGRKAGDKIRIGNDIYVVILEVDRGKVRLGIEAPKNVLVVRTELIEVEGVCVRCGGTVPGECPLCVVRTPKWEG